MTFPYKLLFLTFIILACLFAGRWYGVQEGRQAEHHKIVSDLYKFAYFGVDYPFDDILVEAKIVRHHSPITDKQLHEWELAYKAVNKKAQSHNMTRLKFLSEQINFHFRRGETPRVRIINLKRAQERAERAGR